MQKAQKSYASTFKLRVVEYAVQNENTAARRHFDESEKIVK